MMTTVALAVPTLFVSGAKDQLISQERTQELISTFDPDCVQRYVHSGGHMVPTCSGEFKQRLHQFLDSHAASL